MALCARRGTKNHKAHPDGRVVLLAWGKFHMVARNRQVAALPWRRGAAGIEILLVTTRTTHRWVIPKGWPMEGKADWDAAAIEAYEEAGVRGAVSRSTCGNYNYVKLSDKGKARTLAVTVYALRVDRELSDWPEREERERRWMSCADAAALTGEPDLAPLLRDFVEPAHQSGFWQRLLNWFR
jgi:8-oxo-dGTP pyrophosphatase MutT (NUDIX family)